VLALEPGRHLPEASLVAQHINPQMLLVGFGDGSFVARRGPDGQIQLRVPVKSVCAEKHFYSIPTIDGTPDRVIEDGLAGLEGMTAPVLRRIRSGFPICPIDLQWAATFIAALPMRTESMRATITATIAQQLAEVGAAPNQPLRDHLDAVIVTPDGEEDLRTASMVLMVNWASQVAINLLSQRWQIQRVPARRLVTSREPVAHLLGGDMEITLLALDHQTAIFIHSSHHQPAFRLTSGQINWATTLTTEEIIFHPSQTEPRIQPPHWSREVTLQRGRVPELGLA
jgi:hypothetical protein